MKAKHPAHPTTGRAAKPPRRPDPLRVEERPIAELRLDERNPRTHSPRQVRQIARSIETFGFNVPVLVSRDGQVIAGHGRVLACQHLNWTTVPTICLDHLGPNQMRAFMVADNRLAEISSWNDQLLAETLRDLSLAELDFSLDAIGFEMAEIDLRIESIDAPDRGKEDPADAPVGAAAGPSVSRAGDLWVLGRHRLLCGSALEEDAYTRLMAGKRAAVVFTGPALQRTHRRARQRPGSRPASRVRHGVRRDE